MTALIGIDLALDGKQCGHIAIPHSTHVSAYGKIVVPVVYLRNGEGPRALLSAGVHGDEFEGQIALRDLCLDLAPEDITGSLFILPMANAPAVLQSSRVSPVDGLNLNRLFPGNRLGSPSNMIAHAIEDILLENCDFAYDIHSGGTSLLYDAIAVTTATGVAEDDAKRLTLLRALGVGAGMLLPAQSNMGFETSTDGAMLRKNVIGASVEFGGGGQLSKEMLEQCKRSVRRFLAHTGIVAATHAGEAAEIDCRIFNIDDPSAHLFSDRAGLFVADVDVGSTVAPGDAIGRIYDVHDLMAPPKVVRNALTGTVLALRALPRVEVGDCLVQIGKHAANNAGDGHGN
jgi:uncharacterized protein